jgi:hypothetical protein
VTRNILPTSNALDNAKEHHRRSAYHQQKEDERKHPPALPIEKPANSPPHTTTEILLPKAFITRTNKKGDLGSPFLPTYAPGESGDS